MLWVSAQTALVKGEDDVNGLKQREPEAARRRLPLRLWAA